MKDKIIELVSNNTDKIDQLKGKKVLSISVGDIKKQNSISARSGGPIKITYADNGLVCTKSIWAKFLASPQESYQAHAQAYSQAEKYGISAPIPKPYFYDASNNVVFMEMSGGFSLMMLTLRYSFFLNVFPNEGLKQLFFEIGLWLQNFHTSVDTGEKSNFGTVIEEVSSELKNNSSFSQAEKGSIADSLKRISNRSIATQEFSIVTPHNDFTLRNLFVRRDYGFSIIDWDAMIHPHFPQKTLGWWDLTLLVINIQSMLKLRPIIGTNRIRTLCNAVIQGYVSGNSTVENSKADDFLQCIFYVYTLKYWFGNDSDRPLWEIYGASRGMGSRYVASLRHKLLAGEADVCS